MPPSFTNMIEFAPSELDIPVFLVIYSVVVEYTEEDIVIEGFYTRV